VAVGDSTTNNEEALSASSTDKTSEPASKKAKADDKAKDKKTPDEDDE
jgi:hypothetical protein